MSQKIKQKSNSKENTQKVKVLYQNLGGRWYAFAASEEEEVYFGAVPQKKAGKQATSRTVKKEKDSD